METKSKIRTLLLIQEMNYIHIYLKYAEIDQPRPTIWNQGAYEIGNTIQGYEVSNTIQKQLAQRTNKTVTNML